LDRQKIETQWAAYKRELPQALSEVLFSNAVLPSQIPPAVSTEDLGKWLRKLKGLKSWCYLWADVEMSPSWYLEKSTEDIRPYLFFKGLSHPKEILSQLTLDHVTTESPLVKALLGLCRHGNYSIESCLGLLKEHVKHHTTDKYFDQFWYLAEYWNKAHFEIAPGRKNPLIQVDPLKRVIEFKVFYIKDPKVRHFIKAQVEDEFKGQNWSSSVTFTRNLKQAVVQVKFTKDKNPSHGDSTIHLAADEDLDSEIAKWTIRHEFGHVLGFKDCYLRFLDPLNPKQLLYYEMDLSHLMCTMYGKMTPQMNAEIQSVYLKGQ
jgi:hypothetical protein